MRALLVVLFTACGAAPTHGPIEWCDGGAFVCCRTTPNGGCAWLACECPAEARQ